MSIWGKVIGGFAGFAMGGPLGAILGTAAGHAYDKMKAGEAGRIDATTTRQVAFTTAVIVLSAKMAKADGQVTEDEVADCPLFLTGSASEICERLAKRREETGISYVVIQGDDPERLEAFAEGVVAPLT